MIIIRDTREKKGYWTFAGKRCRSQKLDTGDYTIAGYEDILSIDRKKTATELSQNVGRDWDRFKRELIRMQKIKHSYIVCEFTLAELSAFPWKSKLSAHVKKKIKVRGPFLLRRVQEIRDMGITVLFCGSRIGAILEVTDIFNEILAK